MKTAVYLLYPPIAFRINSRILKESLSPRLPQNTPLVARIDRPGLKTEGGFLEQGR